ncbi:MAG: FAD-dependent oxidoreductase [Thermomicrobiales bacterium]
MQRPDIASISARQFDVIVIGGGINGAAIARDAALRGLAVLLLEKDDFASGTTSWSTRLIHGGLRYLEHREFGLVRESLRERERLLRNAPHLVSPLPLYLPIFRHSQRGLLTIRAGMIAYDALSLDKTLPHHQMLSRRETIEALPGISQDGLKGSAMYYDAQATFPERLVIENLLDASSTGAVVLNYAKVDRIVAEGGRVCGVEWTDLLTGISHEAQSLSIINVTGPWVDDMLAHGGATPGTRPLMGGTKGTHCFLPLPESPPPAIYTEARSDGRAFFILPWNDVMMIGTTDTRFRGNLDDVLSTPDERAYLLTETRMLLPGAHIDPASMLFSYSGIRPLPNTSAGSESGITRKHFVVDHAPSHRGLFSVVGGKLTNHRSLAEHAVNDLCGFLGYPTPGFTADRELPGSGVAGAPHRVDPAVRDRLSSLYGRRAERLYGIATGSPGLLNPLAAGSAAVPAELLLAFWDEAATSLADALIRRMVVAFQPGMGRNIARSAADFCEKHLDWSAQRVASELAAYDAALARFQPASEC